MVNFSNYGQNRDLDCTEDEDEIFFIIRSLLDDDNLDKSVLRLVRKSDSYLSAVMESSSGYGQMDLARFKFTDRAKWIKLCPDFEKRQLTDVEDVAELHNEICAAFRFNEPYL